MEQYEQLAVYFKNKGISQVSIAETLGVSKAYVNALLSGRQRFGKKQAQTWSDQFGLSKSWLLTGEGDMLKPKSEDLGTNVREIGRPFNASTEDEGVYEVRFFQVTPTATFQEFCEDDSKIPHLVPIIPPAGEIISEESCIFEIIGDSMLPQIPNHAKVLCREIPPTKWHNIFDGVIVIAYRDRFVIKRVIKNRLSAEDYLIIDSDNPDYKNEEIVSRADIRCIFEARQVLSYPIV